MRSLSRFLMRGVAGTAVAVGLLLVIELVLRLVVGAPDPLFVRARWDPTTPAFSSSGDVIDPIYQSVDAIPPFVASSERTRVMVFGGSSVRGGSMPLGLEGEFPGLLGRALPEVEVLNLGRPAMDSGAIAVLLEQAVAFEPDVVVLYLGHNDLGNITMSRVLEGRMASWLYRARHLASHLALFQVIEGMLDGGLVRTSPDLPRVTPAERTAAAKGLAANLDAMATRLLDRGVTPIFVVPVVNRWGAGPIGDSCAEKLPQRLWRKDAQAFQLAARKTTPRDLAEAPPDCPEVLWLRAHTERDPSLVRRAIDADPIPIRATTEVLDAIRTTARERGVALVDLDALLSDGSNREWFVDAVHLSPRGHVEVANALKPALIEALAGR